MPSEVRSVSLCRLVAVFSLFTALVFCASPAIGQTEQTNRTGVPARNPQAGSVDSSTNNSESGRGNTPQSPATCGFTHAAQCLKDLGHDQVGIWTSPFRLEAHDLYWLVPFGVATGVALHYDSQAQRNLGVDRSRIDVSNAVSDVGLYGSIAGAGALYVLGAKTHNDHLAETGRLGAEAIANSLLVVETLKLATNRERPDQGNAAGRFWTNGLSSFETDGSFPSGHAATAFCLARVLSDEYPSRRVKFASYAFALAVSASRVTARRHFPSDVLVGGTFGYLIGGYVVRQHATVDGGPTMSFAPLVDEATRTVGLRIEVPAERLGKAGSFIPTLGRKLSARTRSNSFSMASAGTEP
jgi:hypothetical protein